MKRKFYFRGRYEKRKVTRDNLFESERSSACDTTCEMKPGNAVMFDKRKSRYVNNTVKGNEIWLYYYDVLGSSKMMIYPQLTKNHNQ